MPNRKLFVCFYFNYSKVSLSLWPDVDRYSVGYPKGRRRMWIQNCCKYLYHRGVAKHSFFQGGHAYEIPISTL